MFLSQEKIIPKLDIQVKVLDYFGAKHSDPEKVFCYWSKWVFSEKGEKVAEVKVKYFPGKKVAIIDNLDVEPEFRSTESIGSRGYGRSVLNSVNKKLKKHGIVGVLIDGTFGGKDKNHEKVKGWYKRNGWQELYFGNIKRLYFPGRKISNLNELKEISLLVASNYSRKLRQKARKGLV